MTILRINKCTVNFPSFLTKLTYKGKVTDKYGCRLILDNNIHAKEIKIISDIVDKTKEEFLDGIDPKSFNGRELLNNFSTTFRDGNNDINNDWNRGKHYLQAKNDFRAPLFDVNGTRLEGLEAYEIIQPYSVVNVQIEIKSIVKDKAFVLFVLDGIQFVYQGVVPKPVRLPKSDIKFEDASKTLITNQEPSQLTYDSSGEFNQALEQTLAS